MCLFFSSFTYYSSFYFIYAYNFWNVKLKNIFRNKTDRPNFVIKPVKTDKTIYNSPYGSINFKFTVCTQIRINYVLV